MTERTEKRETICAVAQDIMPLLLDEVCSPESRGFVEEHVRTCESCRAVLTHMQAEERQTPSPEAKAKNRAQWQGLRRYCKRLTSRGFLLGLAVTILAAALAAAAYWQLWVVDSTPVPLDEYDVRLVRTADGWVARVFESGTYVGQRSTLGEGDGGMSLPPSFMLRGRCPHSIPPLMVRSVA